MFGVIEACLGTQQTVALFVLFDEGGFVIGADDGKAFIAPLENVFKLTVVTAVHLPSKDLPDLSRAPESDANLASSLEQSAQRRVKS